jgi:hypothetical protein
MWATNERFGLPVNDEDKFHMAINAFIGKPRAHQDFDIMMDLGVFVADPTGRYPNPPVD